MAKPSTHKNETALEPQFISYLRKKGRKVIKDDKIGHDFLVDGHTVEVKYRGSNYSDVLVEMYNCADPEYCPDCMKSGNKKVLLGWGHRSGYSTPDYICYVHSEDGVFVRLVTLKATLFKAWLWDVHLAKQKRHKMISAWHGMHRTLCIAIPLYLIPESLYEEVIVR